MTVNITVNIRKTQGILTYIIIKGNEYKTLYYNITETLCFPDVYCDVYCHVYCMFTVCLLYVYCKPVQDVEELCAHGTVHA